MMLYMQKAREILDKIESTQIRTHPCRRRFDRPQSHQERRLACLRRGAFAPHR